MWRTLSGSRATIRSQKRAGLKLAIVVAGVVSLIGHPPGQCASVSPLTADEAQPTQANLIKVVLIGEEDRRTLTPAEVRQFNGVGRIWNQRHGYAAAVFRNLAVNQNPVTASLLSEGVYVVTAAHFFYEEGKPKSPIDEIQFGHGDFRRQQVETYRIVDLEVGTTHPENHPESDFAIARLDRAAPPNLAVLQLRDLEPGAEPPVRLVLVGYHGDTADGLVPHISRVELKEKSQRRLNYGGSWYKAPEILIFGGHTEGGSSGAPLMSVANESSVYLEALNLGFIRCASWQDGHGFNPRCHFNYGVAVAGNRDFYRAFRRLRQRAEE